MGTLKLWGKRRLSSFVASLSPKAYFKLSYFHNRKRLPDLNNPKDLSEIWITHLLSDKIKNIYYLADKYNVRKYVKDKGLEHILPTLYGVYTSGDQIDFENLPTRFALKANYGAGMNLICSDKSQLTVDIIRSTINKWINNSSKYSYAEFHYNLIKHKVICEEFIDDGNGGMPIDYKFLCIKGKVACILACNGRGSDNAHYTHYDVNWNFIPEYDKLHRAGEVPLPKPANLADMIETAEKLANGLELVRVDLYSNGTKIWFGEMTLTPAGCIFHGWTQKALNDMGDFYHKH